MAKDEANRAACREFDLHLAAYLEGEAAPAVPAHARECPSCEAILADLEGIRQAAGELDLVEPPARVWANVRAQLAQEGVICEPVPAWSRWFHEMLLNPTPLAAFAAVAVFGMFLMVRSRNLEPALAPNVVSNHPVAETVQVARSQAPAPADASETTLARAVKEMEASYQEREKALDPAVKVVYQRSLESLDTSIHECRDSVRQEPSNDLAHEYLLTAYEQKAQVLASALQFEGR